MSPDFLPQRPLLLFRLRKHLLLQDILTGDIDKVINFAQSELAPLFAVTPLHKSADNGSINTDTEHFDQQRLENGDINGVGPTVPSQADRLLMRKELEQAMSLLMFEDVKNAPNNHLFKNECLIETAEMVNKAILDWRGRSPCARLYELIQEAMWVQDQLKLEAAKFPPIVRINHRHQEQ